MLQISLEQTNIRQSCTEPLGFVDGSCVVDSCDDASCFSHDLAIATPTAACVENLHPIDIIETDTGFRLERRPVFVVMGDVISRPLEAEGIEMVVVDKPGNSVTNRNPDGLCFIDQLRPIGGWREWISRLRIDEGRKFGHGGRNFEVRQEPTDRAARVARWN